MHVQPCTLARGSKLTDPDLRGGGGGRLGPCGLGADDDPPTTSPTRETERAAFAHATMRVQPDTSTRGRPRCPNAPAGGHGRAQERLFGERGSPHYPDRIETLSVNPARVVSPDVAEIGRIEGLGLDLWKSGAASTRASTSRSAPVSSSTRASDARRSHRSVEGDDSSHGV